MTRRTPVRNVPTRSADAGNRAQDSGPGSPGSRPRRRRRSRRVDAHAARPRLRKQRLLTEVIMRKILALALLALALAGGVAAGASMLAQPAHACGNSDYG